MFDQTGLNIARSIYMQIALKKIKRNQTSLISISPTFFSIQFIAK
jgi:hypothetical protein